MVKILICESPINQIKFNHSHHLATLIKCYIYPSFPEILGMIKTFISLQVKTPDYLHLNGLIY